MKGKVFVDKQPLNTVKLPLIAKLFPNAKIIFALRDPRDVVFSCFRRHFKVNATMFEFLNLTDSARFYAAIMALAEVLRDKLPLNLFEHRYEDMVVDFETRVRAGVRFRRRSVERLHEGFQQIRAGGGFALAQRDAGAQAPVQRSLGAVAAL